MRATPTIYYWPIPARVETQSKARVRHCPPLHARSLSLRMHVLAWIEARLTADVGTCLSLRQILELCLSFLQAKT